MIFDVTWNPKLRLVMKSCTGIATRSILSRDIFSFSVNRKINNSVFLPRQSILGAADAPKPIFCTVKGSQDKTADPAGRSAKSQLMDCWELFSSY